MTRIYKIIPHKEWENFQQTSHFLGSAIDLQDGFIHFSYAHQLVETARRHFRGQPDLVVLCVEGTRLGPALKDEPSRGGDLFPHLFAGLLLGDVLWARPAPLGADGVPLLPDLDEA